MATCGLMCDECSAYIAKRTDDDVLRAKTAKQWSGPDFAVAAEEIHCDGCAAPGGWFKHCLVCEVRACASTRGVETCAECADYACEKLEALLTHIGAEARANLEALRAG